MDENNLIQVVNMRSFFTREIFMHSLGDIRFSKPIALKQAMYTTVFLLLWTLPIVVIFGFKVNVWFVLIAVVPPIVLGRFANKPIWGGRNLIDFIKVSFQYATEPRGWTDHRNDNSLGRDVYTVESPVWVSRRRELLLLAELKDEQKSGIPARHRIVDYGTEG